jgi:hypothetical protein
VLQNETCSKKAAKCYHSSRSSGKTLIFKEGGGAGVEKEALVFHILI